MGVAPQNVTIDAKCDINAKCNKFLTQNETIKHEM